MASVFDEILLRGVRSGQVPARTKEARKWFRDVAQNASSSKTSPTELLKETDRLSDGPSVGSMYHFKYDPKGKATLPYYDRFPLIFMVGPAQGGFYGLNLHYLPPPLRAKLMNGLYSITNNKKYDNTTKLRLSYDMLKSASKFRYFKPTFKHYLTSHVKSRFIYIAPTEWDIALMLPTQRFSKATADKVYSDSRQAI
jgi:hypothetical protein